MSRYYNTQTGVEVIPPEDITGEGIVKLDDDSVFFKQVPAGMRITYDNEGIPTGYEDIPEVVLTPEQQARQDLLANGITNNTMTVATFLDLQEPGNVTPNTSKMKKDIEDIAEEHGLSFNAVMSILGRS